MPADTPSRRVAIPLSDAVPIAGYLGLPGVPSRWTVLRAINGGDLAADLVGREYRVRPEAFASWLESRRRPATASAPSLPDVVLTEIDRIVASAPPLSADQVRVVVRTLADRLGRGAVA